MSARDDLARLALALDDVVSDYCEACRLAPCVCPASDTLDPVPRRKIGRVVTWRVPEGMVPLGPDGTRALLERWVEAGGRVEPDPKLKRYPVCYSVPEGVAAAVDREAERLSRETGRKVSPAEVVALVWEQYE